MKKNIVLIIAFYSTMGGFAQTQPQEKAQAPTKIESVFLSRGNIIIKEYIPLGEIGRAIFEAVILTYPNNVNAKISGIKVEVSESSSTILNTNIAFLDLDEVENAIKSLDYMIDLAGKWKSEEKKYTEVVYSTKGNFSIGFFQKQTEQKAFISCGSIGKTTALIAVSLLRSAKIFLEKGYSQIK